MAISSFQFYIDALLILSVFKVHVLGSALCSRSVMLEGGTFACHIQQRDVK